MHGGSNAQRAFSVRAGVGCEDAPSRAAPLTCECHAGNSAQRRQASTAAGTPAQSMPEPGTGRSGGAASTAPGAAPSTALGAAPSPALNWHRPYPALRAQTRYWRFAGTSRHACCCLLFVCQLCTFLLCWNTGCPRQGLSLVSVIQLALTARYNIGAKNISLGLCCRVSAGCAWTS